MPKKHSLSLNISLASAAKKAKLSVDSSKTPQAESPTFLQKLLTNLKTLTVRKKNKVTERPTSSPYPETTYSTHVKSNEPTVDNYQGKKTAQIIQFLKDLPSPATIQEIGRPTQGAQADVKFIEIYSPQHTRKLPLACKDGKSTENEIKIHTAIALNSNYDKIKAFLSRPFFLHAKNENAFFYSRLQTNGDLSNYYDYLTQQTENSTTSAYLFNQFRRLVELLTFLHNEAFPDENGHIHHGITHGDIKLNNILLDEQGNFLLADFGCAYFADGPLEYLGMLLQIPPELHIAASRCYTEKVQDSSKSDIWALGLILVQLLTGEAPLEKKAPFKSLAAIDEQIPFSQQVKNAHGYLEPQAAEPAHFLSNNLCGQALRIEWAKEYPESTLCRDAFEANNIIKNLLHKPNQSINTHEILINLGHMMLLPEQDRPSAKQLKTMMDQLAPYFSDDKKAISNFVKKMLLSNSPAAPSPRPGYKTL